MNHELKIYRTAAQAISKFFNGSYPDMVKNPVLLLNYLFQHSFISRPIYTVIFEQNNTPSYFIVSCVVDEISTQGTGSSKKVAKTHSAQAMLSLIQNFEDNLSATSIENCESEPFESSSDNSYSEIMTQYVETLSLQCRSECLSFDPSDDLVEPQWDNTETILPQSLKRTFSCADGAENEDFSMETEYRSKEGISVGNTNGEIMSLTDYFDPYYHMRNPSSQSSMSSTSSDAENIKPHENLSETINGDQAKPQPNTSKSKSKNRSKKESKRAKLSTVSTSYVLDSYFDPFFKLKPPIPSCVDRNISRTCVANPKVNEFRAESDAIKADKTSTPENEAPKVEKIKSPFAVLQEKSIKNLKLIPRCTIDRDGEGFKCKLVLDSYSSEGTGQSKKLAKINAAVALLNQLEERS